MDDNTNVRRIGNTNQKRNLEAVSNQNTNVKEPTKKKRMQ